MRASVPDGSFLLPAVLVVFSVGCIVRLVTGWPVEYLLYLVLAQLALLIGCAVFCYPAAGRKPTSE